ncbi:hypothetical protein N7474_010934 [Penicillium riverlandense]|uniref:uncharacterized protein n=1 Tax=Penicillium riverlandense TaxID=1903569 RepID=UPI00254915F4|nr:uncharacterized protein N7474_010934 [Penicillium riverlandense]KAJ5805047.1 hypothetical protein N7474_010934 [Penicillium riverlandense]
MPVRQKVNVHEQTPADRINDIGMRGTVRDAERDRAWLTVVIASVVTHKFMSSMFSAGVSANSRIMGVWLVVAVILRALLLILGVVLLAAGSWNRQGVAAVAALVVLGRARVNPSGLDHALPFAGLMWGILLKRKDDAHFDPFLSKEHFQVV